MFQAKKSNFLPLGCLADSKLKYLWIMVSVNSFWLGDSIPSWQGTTWPLLFTLSSPLGWNLVMQNNLGTQPLAWRELQLIQNTAVRLSHTHTCTSNCSAVLYNGTLQRIKGNWQYWSLSCSVTRIWGSLDFRLSTALRRRQLMITIPLTQ